MGSFFVGLYFLCAGVIAYLAIRFWEKPIHTSLWIKVFANILMVVFAPITICALVFYIIRAVVKEYKDGKSESKEGDNKVETTDENVASNDGT